MSVFALATVTNVAFATDGKYHFTASAYDAADLWETETGNHIRPFQLSGIRMQYGEWHFPYCITYDCGICKIYKFDCFNPKASDEPEYLGTFYSINGLGIRGCSFKDITADEIARKILYQYGAEL